MEHEEEEEDGDDKADERFVNGSVTLWHENGQKWLEENFKDGKQDGLWIFYNEDGTEDYRHTYKDGEVVED